jgi:hypothetical protein
MYAALLCLRTKARVSDYCYGYHCYAGLINFLLTKLKLARPEGFPGDDCSHHAAAEHKKAHPISGVLFV